MTETRALVQKATPASSRRFCVQHSVLGSLQTIRKEGKIPFTSILPIHRLLKNYVVRNYQSRNVLLWFWEAGICGSPANTFWEAAGFTELFASLARGGVGQSAPAGARSAGRNVLCAHWAMCNAWTIHRHWGIPALQNWRIHKQGSILGHKTLLSIPGLL